MCGCGIELSTLPPTVGPSSVHYWHNKYECGVCHRRDIAKAGGMGPYLQEKVRRMGRMVGYADADTILRMQEDQRQQRLEALAAGMTDKPRRYEQLASGDEVLEPA